MNYMRYILLTSCMFLLSCVTLFSQRTFYRSTKFTLEIDYDESYFSLYIKYPEEPKVHMAHVVPISLEYFAEGTLRKEMDLIICVDTLENKYLFKLKQLTQFTIKVESSSAEYLVPQDTLYATECQFKDFIISNIKFKNNLPDGAWTVWQPPVYYIIRYEEGKIMKIENITNKKTPKD